MNDHPYLRAPAWRRWRSGVTATGGDTDPVVSWPWRLMRDHKLAAAGSCFAEHIARYLKASGFGFVDVEPAHPILGSEIARSFGYGVYSARFGNIYTARQLLQLLRRASERFSPAEAVWEDSGRFYDPYRPSIQPGGFATRQEFEIDQARHLSAVRLLFADLDVMVFTLGLTEAWISAIDGAVFPVCPGVAAGRFNPERHVYRNFEIEEIYDDLAAFHRELREINPAARLILTVSPVPLAATAEDRHVLVSTIYSKSVLRAAAERAARLDGIDYFPSYEIITGPQARGRYFAQDLRSITEDGVHRVMQLFFRHVAGEELANAPEVSDAADDPGDAFKAGMEKVVAAMCDEEMLDAAP